MRPEELFQALVDQDENEAVEFKSAAVRPEPLASEIVAFANTSGGHILLGVGDCGELEGLPGDKPYEEWVVNIARENVNPAFEVISPGNMHNSVTIEKLPVGVSYAPNPVLLKFMENLKYVDKLGRGLPMVCQDAKRLGVQVGFEEVGVEFKVTFPFDHSIL